MDKKVGIWIDKTRANIISFIDNKPKATLLKSQIETYHPKGGSRSKTPYGPVITVKEKSFLEREKRQHKLFFDQIWNIVKEKDAMVIIGPSQMKEELVLYINKRKGPKPQIISVQSADSMTDNQIVAVIKDMLHHI